MKYTNLLAGAALLASTAFASAADISYAETITLTSLDDIFNADFGNTFGAADKGKTFLDVYTFNVPTSVLGASFSSPATFKGSLATSNLSFSAFDLYDSSGLKVATGQFSSLGSGIFTGWDAGAINTELSTGTYSLQISGTVLGSSGGLYTGGVTVSPVPEPETWGMTLSGLAAVGFMARHRRAKSAKSA